MSAPLKELGKGAEGEALGLAGEILEAHLDRAYAPGAPAELRVAIEERELSLRGKTVSVKRQPDGRFALRFRLLSLRREEREALSRLGG